MGLLPWPVGPWPSDLDQLAHFVQEERLQEGRAEVARSLTKLERLLE